MSLINLFACFRKVFSTMQDVLCLCSLQMQEPAAAFLPVKSQVMHQAPREEEYSVNLHLHWQTKEASCLFKYCAITNHIFLKFVCHPLYLAYDN